jgi:LPXTG-site transpeptidase (sortase) family protein
MRSTRKRLPLLCLMLGVVLFSGGAGMRIYASASIASTGQRLLAVRPTSPDAIGGTMHTPFVPADGAPTEIRLPDLDLWNSLDPVSLQLDSLDGQLSWEVRDAGWHVSSGWPGQGHNVVIAGHSPSQNMQIWPHSIFRQLAYLKPGDVIELTAGTHHYRYNVSNVFAIPAQDAQTADAYAWILPGTAERLTLVTCWPPNTAAYRVIVIAQPMEVYR